MKNLTGLLFILITQLAAAQQVIQLYDWKPAGSEDWTWSEQISHDNALNIELVYNVVQPTLTAYLPPYYLATGTAVIIAPGGGFHFLSIDSEGVKVAEWLNSIGVAAFVLKYRLAHSLTGDPLTELRSKMANFKKLDEANATIVPLAMQDGLTAVKYVRQHAGELDINPDKIGFMGFSAGGTITMSVVYNAREEERPNFVAPIYAYEPAIIGSEIPSVKTPIFVAAASDDQLGLTTHSLHIYEKWLAAKQPAELHLYEQGGHGFGMRIQNLPTDRWYERFGQWLQLQGYLKRLYPSKYEKLFGEEAVARGEIERVEQLMQDFGNLAKYKDANQKVKPVRPDENRVVFLGNSITEGWVRSDSSFFARNDYIGRGISGQTSSQLLLRFRQDVLALKPKAVVIHIGTNDVAENTGPYNVDFTMGNIRSMVELAQLNNLKVILASVLPATKFEWRRSLGDRSDMILNLNSRIKAYAAEIEVPYNDYHSALKNDKNGMDLEIAEDGVHPTLQGYQIMERLAKTVIDQVLKE